MSYNLLFDTEFKNINSYWNLQNCTYQNGYLISNSHIFSIEQEITLSQATKLYFSLDYICFDSNISKIYCGIQINNTLEVTVKKPRLHNRARISVVDNSQLAQKIKIKFIVESKVTNSKIYIDSPLLVDLIQHNKEWWPKWVLNKTLDYRFGYTYKNILDNDKLINNIFSQSLNKVEEAKTGVIIHVIKDDCLSINANLDANRFYLMKLNYQNINDYGKAMLKYDQTNSIELNNQQLAIIFKTLNQLDTIKLTLAKEVDLPYLINLKQLLLIDITDLKLDQDDIAYLPFI